MKTLLTTLCLLLAVSAYGQGTAVRADTGTATNLTLRNGFTIRPGTPASNVGITNIGVMFFYLGSGPLGTQMAFIDTNNIGRIVLAGNDFSLVDVAGNTQLRVNATGIEGVTGIFVGNGAGLTNLAGATNFNSSVTYNFNGKTTFNAVSYNTNKWEGPTNTLVLSTNYQDYITTTDVNITNVGGQLARQNTWATLTLSNAAASSITARVTAPGVRAQGASTSAALVIASGKEAIFTFLCRDFKSTNYCNTVEQ